MKEDQLKGYFAFDEKDLLANRSGKFSEKQLRRQKDLDDWANKFVLGLFLFFLVLELVLGYFAIRARTNVSLWIWSGVVLLGVIWVGRGVFTKVDHSLQKAQGRVEFIKVERMSGSPNDPEYKRQKVSSYEMHVGGEVFQNANPALIEYMQGCEFIVYYIKSTRQILSVEQVSTSR